MTTYTFRISAFGDEIADRLHDQLVVLKELNIRYLELRGVWGKNVLELDDDEARKVQQLCAAQGIGISCIGSPVGKSAIVDPVETELANLERTMRTAEIAGTRRIRVFSFYPPASAVADDYDQYVDASLNRLTRLAELAQRDGFTLLLENERGIVGDTVARCAALMAGLAEQNVKFVWDPANFVLVNEARVTEQGWASLGGVTEYVHVKDARLADGAITPAGEGDGQIGALLINLRDRGYDGFLALEPHLAVAGHSSGFSGPDGMAAAAAALRRVMAETGCAEG